MKTKKFSFLVILLILISLTYAVSDPRPIITAKFNESVTIINVTLNDLSKNIIELEEKGQYTEEFEGIIYNFFRYQPEENLKEGWYNFSVLAEDDVGNKKQTSYNFTVKYDPLNITIAEPSYGVTSEDVFDVRVTTIRNADCRNLNFDVSYDIMSEDSFDVTGGTTHIINNYSASGDSENFYVKCNDTLYGNIFSDNFRLVVDTTNPGIDSIDINPKARYESEEGIDGYPFNITVYTNEETVCRYDDAKENYSEMSDFSSAMNIIHQKQVIVDHDNSLYKYNLMCKNKADMLSDLKTFSFLVNTSEPAKLTLVRPLNWISETPFIFEVHTTRKSVCWYVNGTEDIPFYKDSDLGSRNNHQLQLDLDEGTYDYEIKCVYKGGAMVSERFGVKIDKTRPTKPVVNDSGLEDYPEYTFSLDELKAVVRASDNLSGIKEFSYRILSKADYTLMKNGTTDRGSCDNGECIKTIIADDLDLQNNTKYYFKVRAIDYAGLESAEGESDGIIVDPSKRPKERIKPRGWITKEQVEGGIKVTIHCQDIGSEASGCDFDSYKYDTASSKDACSLIVYREPVIVREIVWFCWKVSDKAGNTAEGSEFINTTKEVELTDKDNDGIADIEDNCINDYNPRQDDSDLDGIGDICDNCPDEYNPGQDDDDYDDVGDECDLCPDTKMGEKVNSYGCKRITEEDEVTEEEEGIGTDRDNDGIPDDWETSHGLDPDDSSDAELDNDEDGLNNLEEYSHGTNPNNVQSDADEYTDKEEIDAGTDPLDPNSYPKPKSNFWSILLLIMGILILMGGAGYLVYNKYIKKEIPMPKPTFTPRPPPARPAVERPRLQPGPRLTPEQQKVLLKKVMRKREEKYTERRKVFEGFKPAKPIPGIPKVAKPAKKVTTPEVKKPIPGTPKAAKAAKKIIKEPTKPKDVFSRLSKISKKKE